MAEPKALNFQKSFVNCEAAQIPVHRHADIFARSSL